MSIEKKVEVGQKVWSLNVGNAARNRPQVLTPCVVTKVGRKYFSARQEDDTTGWSEMQYRLDNGVEVSEYLPRSVMYFNKQEWEDEKLEREITNRIYDLFKYGKNSLNLSLDALKQIDAILTKKGKME